MKKTNLMIAAAGAALIATPAAAEVSGPRVEAIVGYDSIDTGLPGIDDANGVTYGVGVGFDFPVNPEFSFGIDAEISESSADLDVGPFEIDAARDLYVGGRATFAATDALNLYLKAGYTNLKVKTNFAGSDEADGFRGGIGAQYSLGGNLYVGAEYRYSDYEADITRNQVVGVVGMRF